MLYIIGRSNCKSCSELNVALQNNNINYIYLDLDKDIHLEAKREYAKMIREENAGKLPLIINDGIVTSIDEMYSTIRDISNRKQHNKDPWDTRD